MASPAAHGRQAKKLRLFSFWEETEGVGSPWLKRAWQRSTSKLRTRSDMEMFKQELERAGITLPGITLCNCEMSGGNDISLIYPWVHISPESADIAAWLSRQSLSREERLLSPVMRRYVSQDISGGSTSNIQIDCGKRLIQGSYSIVEALVPSQEILRQGDELAVLLGFRTTDDNCVDTADAEEERSEEAKSWRDWTGIVTLYSGLAKLSHVQVHRIEFLESHVPNHTAVFHYLVLLFLQVESESGRVSVLDTVARFRVRNMSGYVTLYSCIDESCPPTSIATFTKDSVLRKVAEDKESREQARREFLAS